MPDFTVSIDRIEGLIDRQTTALSKVEHRDFLEDLKDRVDARLDAVWNELDQGEANEGS